MQKLSFSKKNRIRDSFKKRRKLFLITSLLSFFILSIQKEVSATSRTFFCGSESYRGELTPTTYIRPETGGNPVALIYWVKDYFNDPPEERCLAATNKMQAYYDNGELEHINTDVIGGLPVLCIAQNANHRCTSSDVVVTLRPETDRFQALDVMLNLLRRIGDDPLEITDDLLIYRRGEEYLNLDVFLEKVQNR